MIRSAILVLLFTTLATGLSLAQDDLDATAEPIAPENAAWLRIANFSVDSVAVDLWLNGERSELTQIDFPMISEYISIPAGTTELVFSPAGGPWGEPVVEPLTLALDPQRFYTVILTGSLGQGTIQTTVLPENLNPVQPGTARVTYFQGIEGVGPLAFFRDEFLYTTLNYGGNLQIEHDAATYAFHVETTGETARSIAEQADVSLRTGQHYLIAAVGEVGANDEVAPQLLVDSVDPAIFRIGRGEIDPPGTVVQAVEAEGLTGALSEAIEIAQLSDLLTSEGPFTLLAPAELRLQQFPAETTDAIAQVLRSHIVEGEFTIQELLRMGTVEAVDGTLLEVTSEGNNIYVDGTQVLKVNIEATNGIIHMVRGLLVP